MEATNNTLYSPKEYIERLESKRANLKSQEREVLELLQDAYFKHGAPSPEYKEAEKNADKVIIPLRRVEEELMIARSVYNS